MEKEQAREWAEAQEIKFSVDLVESAKKVMKFLGVVDQNRHLYEDDVLHRAIYRYNAFWLPLLAKHMEKPVCGEDPLVVPLDCEWIWHCHMLNPLRYKSDCEQIFGKILSNRSVISTAEATSKGASEEVWNKMYPDEPYELDLNKPFLQNHSKNEKFTSYDLVAAVKRQISFTYQMSRPYTTDDQYLQEAVARYKGFLHMIRTNDKRAVKCFCVPTYDIDLIWHTHQLHPDSYCKDLTEMVGRVLHHNDTVSDRSPDKPLYTGFSQITAQWDEIFGKSYWKAGTLHRGNSPTPVTQIPVTFNSNVAGKQSSRNPVIQFPSMKLVEVLLEFAEIKNLREEHRGNVIVYFSKKQADRLLNTKRSLAISSKSSEKRVASFQCEPTGEFLFELVSNSAASNEPTPQKSMKLLGSCSLSLEELTTNGSQLSADTWLSVQPVSGNLSSEPILLRARISFTPPSPAPRVFHLARSQRLSNAENAKLHTLVLDQVGKEVLSLHTRDVTSNLVKEVYCITDSGEEHKLADFTENHWFVKGSNGSFKLRTVPKNDDILFELVGPKMVKLFYGRRLDFETIPLENQKVKKSFVTAVEFSSEYPYGKAVALIDFTSDTITATEDWMILPGIALAFVLSDILKDEIDFETRNVIQGIAKTVGKYGGQSMKMVKNGVLAECGECSDCGSGCAHVKNTLTKNSVSNCCYCLGSASGGSEKNMLSKDAFADCAKCYFCGVIAGDGSDKNDGNKVGARCLVLGGVAGGDDNGGKIGGVRCFIGGSNKASADVISEGDENVGNISGVRCFMGGNNKASAPCFVMDVIAEGTENSSKIGGAGCFMGGNNKVSAPCFVMEVVAKGAENGSKIGGAGCFMGGSNKASAPCFVMDVVAKGAENGSKIGGAGCFMDGSNKASAPCFVMDVVAKGAENGSKIGGAGCFMGGSNKASAPCFVMDVVAKGAENGSKIGGAGCFMGGSNKASAPCFVMDVVAEGAENGSKIDGVGCFMGGSNKADARCMISGDDNGSVGAEVACQ
ncbi:hypothetical protein RND81_02G142900 [Saponaria officinalis]|uniref:Glycine-rich domain-containing protein 1 n=1 Tax=Saponaria officinalis TaxID=3572 RepID=A0AAW1MV57_SAPOF